MIASDLHPEYLSTRHATKLVQQQSQPLNEEQVSSVGRPFTGNLGYISVQHHYAHVIGCMAENRIEPPLLGVAWDGSGYGPDETIWGGEFLLVDESSFKRVAHLRQFRLPGGENAIKQPRRVALSLLYETLGDAAFADLELQAFKEFSPSELAVLRQTLTAGINAPLTSSAGRVFDGVASLAGLCSASASRDRRPWSWILLSIPGWYPSIHSN